MTPGRLQSERGAELVEFALVFPLLLLVVLGVIDFGLLFQRYEVVTNAAREGARIAVLPGYGAEDVQFRVAQFLTAGGLSNTPTVNTDLNVPRSIGGNCMNVAVVSVSYPHTYLFLGGIIGYFGGGGFATSNLTATVEMRAEQAAVPCS